MTKYTKYCTEEQTLRAHKLGAPLESGIADCNPFDTHRPFIYREPELNCFAWNNSSCWFCPTTQQMIGWLREKGFRFYIIDATDIRIDIWKRTSDNCADDIFVGMIGNHCEIKDIYDGELAAIDKALDYLEKGE